MPSSFGALNQPASCIKEDQQMSTTAIPDRFTTLPDENNLQATYGQHSQVGKILQIHQELPGRIHIVLIRQRVGF
jgi:hypothetical protein